jgi:hypothetical protein
MIRALTLTFCLPILFAVGCSDSHSHDGKGDHSHDSKADHAHDDKKVTATAAKPAPAAPAPAPAPAAKADDHGHDHGDGKDHGHDHGHDTAAASQPAAKVPGESPDTRDHKDADGIVRRGEKLSTTATLKIDQCIAKAKDLAGKSVKCEGTVTQVCVKKGCWFALAANTDAKPADTVRITSEGYRFFVPTDAVGQTAVVEGKIEIKEMSIEEAQHMADDAAKSTGKPAEKVTAPQVEVRIASVAVEMKKAGS